MKKLIYLPVILLLCSCHNIKMINFLSHQYAKNPKVMTEEECLQYARTNLREGIREIYVVDSEPTDSAMDEAMYYYFAYPQYYFDENGLEYDSISTDTTFSCGWSRFGTIYKKEHFGTILLHTDSARTLDYRLKRFRKISGEEPAQKAPVTFILGLSPDNQKMNLTCDDINQLYDAWNGECRIIVVITNPQESWGLKAGKRVKYKLELDEVFEETKEHTSFSTKHTYKYPRK